MFFKKLGGAIAVVALCAAAVSPVIAFVEAWPSAATENAAQYRVSALRGLRVMTPHGVIGHGIEVTVDQKAACVVNDLLVDSSGKITNIVCGVGGFLGIGRTNVLLPFQDVMIHPSGTSQPRLTTWMSPALVQSRSK